MITIYLCKLDFYLFELIFKLHFWKFYFFFKNELVVWVEERWDT